MPFDTMTIAAVLALAAACQSAVDPATVAGIALAESRNTPLAIHDNTGRQTYAPATRQEAARLERRLISDGHSFDAGLLQINRFNFPWLGLTPETVLDPCTNIAAGAAILVAYSKYNTGSDRKGISNGYAAKVSAAISHVRATVPAAPAGGPLGAAANPFTGPAKTGRDVAFDAGKPRRSPGRGTLTRPIRMLYP